MANTRVLVVEDEEALATLLEYNLRRENFDVALAADGEEALMKIEEFQPDIVILDWMLPRVSGIEVCRQIRSKAETKNLPIIMLTARSEEADRIRGLETGADDYLTKPFSMAELLARVKALLRRAEVRDAAQAARGAAGSERPIVQGDLQIWPTKRTVAVRAQPVELTALEFDLLLHFAQHPGRVFSRAQLLDAVWGYSHDGYEHTVTTHINRLRSKLERDPMHPEWVLTVRGAGYKFKE